MPTDLKKNEMCNYQMVGPNLWNECFNRSKEVCKTHILEKSDVYPYDCEEIHLMYSNTNQIKDNTFAIHWYNGHSGMKHFINSLNLANLNPNNTILEKMLVNVIYTPHH